MKKLVYGLIGIFLLIGLGCKAQKEYPSAEFLGYVQIRDSLSVDNEVYLKLLKNKTTLSPTSYRVFVDTLTGKLYSSPSGGDTTIWKLLDNYVILKDNTDSVGIGTSSPSAKLEVAGGILSTGNITIGDTLFYRDGTYSLTVPGGTSDSNYFQFTGGLGSGWYINDSIKDLLTLTYLNAQSYLIGSDTLNLRSNINTNTSNILLGVKYNDSTVTFVTPSQLSNFNYLTGSDTTSLSNRIDINSTSILVKADTNWVLVKNYLTGSDTISIDNRLNIITAELLTIWDSTEVKSWVNSQSYLTTETDPIWISDSSQYYTKIVSDGKYLTGNEAITLSGDATGSGTTSIAVTVIDDSHNHIISNIDNLQDSLDNIYIKTEVNNLLNNKIDINDTNIYVSTKYETDSLGQILNDSITDNSTNIFNLETRYETDSTLNADSIVALRTDINSNITDIESLNDSITAHRTDIDLKLNISDTISLSNRIDLKVNDSEVLKKDGSVGLTSNWDAGSFDIRSSTLTADGLTSGRVLFSETNGLLSDDANLTWDSTNKLLSVKGLGHAGATNVLLLEDDNGTDLFTVNDLGYTGIGGITPNNYIQVKDLIEFKQSVWSTFLGYRSGKNNTTGYGNTFIGYDAGKSATTGNNNTAIGSESGNADIIGNDNTFIGTLSGKLNTSGSSNTFIGTSAGNLNTSGNSNSFIGRYSGNRNINGNQNVSIGSSSGGTTDGNYNISIGTRAGKNITSGYSNIYIGTDAGNLNTKDYNIFIGYGAGQNNKEYSNVLIIENSIDTLTPLIYGEFDNDYLKFGADSVEIQGFLRTDSVITLTTTYADDVFNDDYKFLSLEEKSEYWKENKHLPALDSQAKLEAQGNRHNLGTRLEQTVRELEEAYLIIYKQNEELNYLKQEINEIKTQLK